MTPKILNGEVLGVPGFLGLVALYSKGLKAHVAPDMLAAGGLLLLVENAGGPILFTNLWASSNRAGLLAYNYHKPDLPGICPCLTSKKLLTSFTI